MRKVNVNTRQMSLKWGLIALLLVPAYNFYLNGIIQYSWNMASISALSYIIMALMGVFSYTVLNKGGKNKAGLMSGLLLIGTIVSYLIYPDIRTALIAPGYNPLDSQAVMLFLYCVPAMILASKLTTWENLHNIVAKLGMVLIPIAIFSYWVQIQALGVLEIDYMSISTFLVLPICAACSYGYMKQKWYPFVLALFGIAFIFICGSRGALVCSLMGLLICVYRRFRHSGLVYRIFMLAMIVAAVGYFGSSFISTADSAADSGLGRGRTLMKMEEGSFFVSAGREEIGKVIDAGIWNNPLGYGLFGDRHIMVKGGLPPSYCHSIIREFICDFGIVVGAILLIYLFYMIYKTLRRTTDVYALEIMIMVSCAGVLHLFTSGTYLTDICFWAMVGLMMNPYIRQKKYETHLSSL